MEPAVNDTDTSSFEPHGKRRKLRKGTTSCWDCKKRKVKCTFDATSDTICVTCRRRNAPCVRQDQPDEVLDDISQPLASLERSDASNKTYPTPGLSYEQLLERLRRAETLLAQSEDSRHDPATSYVQLPTPSSAALTPEHGLLEAEDSGNISISLRQTFPPQRDLDLLCRSNRSATLYSYKCLTRPNNLLEDESFDIVDELATVPDASTTPPVVVARHMLILALMLQYFRCNGVDRLSGDPNALAVRMVDAAVRLVIANDQLVGCIEGLECIIYEAMFQSNAGNLRRAWIAFRRAMIFAQLMRLDSPNPPPVKLLENKHRVNTKFLWSRIVHMDSYLSLMLGLPHGGQTTNMEISIPGETLSDRIDRAHTLIARGIVERNRGDPRQNIEATRKLDIDLQNVTKSLPDKYWLAPSFTRLQQSTKEASEELMRLRDQLYQYNLLHLLHLPFLIHCGKELDYHMYAKITCINAARDVLTRFVAYQNFRPTSAQSSHTADFFALMAGMTILIAHIDSCHWQNNNFLVHQRPGDRAMIEQLVEKLEHVAAQSNESLTGKSAEQLRSLLEIEGDAARGSRHTGESAVDRLEEGCGEQFQLSIPYFGIIKICVKGITREQPGQLASDADMPAVPSSLNPMAAYDNVFSAFGQDINDNASSDFLAAQPNTQNFQTLQSGVTSSDAIFDTPQHYPGLTAGTNDWAFQGVDAAFFDSLMKGVGDWEDTTGDLIVSTNDHI